MYNTTGVTCIPHSRTLPAEPLQCRLGQREQANYVSSFLDASFIYGNKSENIIFIHFQNLGSSIEESRKLRGENGQLQTSSQNGVNELPLQDRESGTYCKSQNPNINKCFVSGSKTVNLLPGITSLHTIWIRQHNKIALKLKVMNFWEK